MCCKGVQFLGIARIISRDLILAVGSRAVRCSSSLRRDRPGPTF